MEPRGKIVATVADAVAVQLTMKQSLLTDHTGEDWWQSLEKVRVVRKAWVGEVGGVLEGVE